MNVVEMFSKKIPCYIYYLIYIFMIKYNKNFNKFICINF